MIFWATQYSHLNRDIPTIIDMEQFGFWLHDVKGFRKGENLQDYIKAYHDKQRVKIEWSVKLDKPLAVISNDEQKPEDGIVSKMKGQIKAAHEVVAGDIIIVDGNHMLKVLFVQWHSGLRMVVSCIDMDRLPVVLETTQDKAVFVVTDQRVTGHQ